MKPARLLDKVYSAHARLNHANDEAWRKLAAWIGYDYSIPIHRFVRNLNLPWLVWEALANRLADHDWRDVNYSAAPTADTRLYVCGRCGGTAVAPIKAALSPCRKRRYVLPFRVVAGYLYEVSRAALMLTMASLNQRRKGQSAQVWS